MRVSVGRGSGKEKVPAIKEAKQTTGNRVAASDAEHPPVVAPDGHPSASCGSGGNRKCPQCGYVVESYATRCPRCLAAMPGWSCAECSLRASCSMKWMKR